MCEGDVVIKEFNAGKMHDLYQSLVYKLSDLRCILLKTLMYFFRRLVVRIT